MSQIVYDALKSQHEVTGKLSPFVFCTPSGSPLHYCNVTNRVWIPTLRLLGLKVRRAYETRHTTATLWLAVRGKSGMDSTAAGSRQHQDALHNLLPIYPQPYPSGWVAFERLLMTKQNQEVSNDNR